MIRLTKKYEAIKREVKMTDPSLTHDFAKIIYAERNMFHLIPFLKGM